MICQWNILSFCVLPAENCISIGANLSFAVCRFWNWNHLFSGHYYWHVEWTQENSARSNHYLPFVTAAEDGELKNCSWHWNRKWCLFCLCSAERRKRFCTSIKRNPWAEINLPRYRTARVSTQKSWRSEGGEGFHWIYQGQLTVQNRSAFGSWISTIGQKYLLSYLYDICVDVHIPVMHLFVAHDA